MKDKTTYLKSVEEYFLNHAGKGIMLSSIDYELINTWKKRNIPLQLVLSTIREVFSENEENNDRNIRNLQSVAELIEKSFNEYHPSVHNINESFQDAHNTLKLLFDKINYDINNIDDKRVIDCLIKYKDEISRKKHTSGSIKYVEMSKLERGLMDSIYNLLTDSEKKDINRQTELLLKEYRTKFTEHAYNKSLRSHRDNIIRKKFHLTFMD